jgi:hypothetical protein
MATDQENASTIIILTVQFLVERCFICARGADPELMMISSKHRAIGPGHRCRA